jgi:hypothetical protein
MEDFGVDPVARALAVRGNSMDLQVVKRFYSDSEIEMPSQQEKPYATGTHYYYSPMDTRALRCAMRCPLATNARQ